MKLLFTAIISLLSFSSLLSQAQFNIINPNITIGRGIADMKGIGSFVGIGYDLGFNFKDSPTGIYAFWSRNTYYREKFDGPVNYKWAKYQSNFHTFGLKFRYAPFESENNSFFPFIDIGGGVVMHNTYMTGRYNTTITTYEQASYDPNCPKSSSSTTSEVTLKDKNHLLKSYTYMGSLDLGFLYKLGDLSLFNSNLYLKVSFGLEYGGGVNFIDPKRRGSMTSPNTEYSDEQDRISSIGRGDNSNLKLPNHSVLIFRISLINFRF